MSLGRRSSVDTVPLLLAAPDKFRGTASAAEIAAVMAAAAHEAGWGADVAPLSDGGEGLLRCFGGPNRYSDVAGPLGEPVRAPWRLDAARAVIEMAAASGLGLVAGRNDPMAAHTRGTGQLVHAAIEAGAREIIVGVGGSASTDGGLAALEILRPHTPLDGSRGPRVIVACDVHTTFVDAARFFAPQKGATEQLVDELTERLRRLAVRYAEEFGVDVRALAGAGAAGGLAGGLAALGAQLRPGFDLVADEIGLPRRIAAADLVLTGEGQLDDTSLQGKATSSLVARCAQLGVPAVIVAGRVAGTATGALPAPGRVVDLSAEYGAGRALSDVLGCVHAATLTLLRGAAV